LAFDLLAGEGEDLRSLPLGIRKVGLAQLLADKIDGRRHWRRVVQGRL
jgi:ATP-dependent DNA ligase